MIMIMIICTITIINVEYIWLASFYAIQIEVFAAVAYVFNHLIHTVCAPPHRFLDLPLPTTPNEKDSPPPSLVGTFSRSFGFCPNYLLPIWKTDNFFERQKHRFKQHSK